MKVAMFWVVLSFGVLHILEAEMMTKRSDDAGTLEPVIQQLTGDVTQLQALITSLESKIASMDSHIKALEAKENEHVVFTASIGASNVRASQDSVIPFNHVITNSGNAYDPSTSVFRAPYDGQYMFVVSVDVSSDYRALTIRKSGHTVIIGHNDSDKGIHITTAGAVTLRQGDTVAVYHSVNNGTVDGGPEALFTGFRIR